MKKIRVLNILFDAELRGYEVPAFRSAIIEKAGRENILFHQHLNNNGFLYKYPLIQYKQINKKPAIICIDYGVDEIHKFFENKNWDIKIGEKWIELKIFKLNLNQFNMQVWDKRFKYSITNWIALNKENFEDYLLLENLTERVNFLEKILKANILSFAKGIEWTIDKQIELAIINMQEPRKIKLKSKNLLGFNVDFKTNVFLPNYIGLGKAVSKGFGIVKQYREINEGKRS